MAGKALGILLIIIAIILAVVQHFVTNLYGDASNKWYFYGALVIIGIIGIILVGWGFMKPGAKVAKAPKETTAAPAA